MNRETTIRLASASGLEVFGREQNQKDWLIALDVFAVLILSAERKAIIEAIDDLYDHDAPDSREEDGLKFGIRQIRQLVEDRKHSYNK